MVDRTAWSDARASSRICRAHCGCAQTRDVGQFQQWPPCRAYHLGRRRHRPASDGDYLPHDERYARTDEYVDILKRVWTAERPVDYEGKYYRFKGAFPDIKPVQKPHIPIYFGGTSDAAIEVGAKRADIYAIWGEPLADSADIIRKVRAAAARHGRTVRFIISFRPI